MGERLSISLRLSGYHPYPSASSGRTRVTRTRSRRGTKHALRLPTSLSGREPCQSRFPSPLCPRSLSLLPLF